MSRTRFILVALIVLPRTMHAQDSTGSHSACRTVETTAEIRQCLNAANIRADTLLRTALQQARSRAMYPLALDSAQAAWDSYRSVQCRAESSQFEGGSLQLVVYLSCRLTLTQARARYVTSLFDEP